ncbi:MAG: LamG-like jellyroll fold domain-containing protein [Candidatus Paceibacterota bacterium]
MRKINAFTLIELLVVIAIIGILSTLIVIGMSSTTQKATIAKAQAFSHSVDSALMSSKVSEWKFESGTHTDGQSADTTDIKDTWGTNDASAVSGPLIKENINCVSEKCLSFDGNDYIDYGNATALDSIFDSNYTLSVWIKSTSTSQIKTIWSSTDVNNGYRLVHLNYPSVGKLKFHSGAGSDTSGLDSNASNLNNSQWRYLIFILDGTTQKIYIDGSFDNSRTKIAGTTTSNTNFFIGKNYSSIYFFEGLIDDVRLYDEAIPTSQIQQNYFAGLNKLFAKQGVEISEYQQRVASLDQNFNVSEHN